MKTPSLYRFGIIGLLLSGFTMYGATPVHTEHPSSSHDQKAAKGMMMGVPSPSTDPTPAADPQMGGMDMTAMMEKMGMNPSMMARGKMMMHATIDQGDPAALLGLADKLELSPKQRATLQKIARNARTAAHKVLTDVQLTLLEKIPDGPSSMAEMHASMMAHMQTMSHDMPSACPMMKMMMTDEADSAPENPSKGDHAAHSHD